MTFAEIWMVFIAAVGGVVVYGAIGGLALIGVVRVADLLISLATWVWNRWLEA